MLLNAIQLILNAAEKVQILRLKRHLAMGENQTHAFHYPTRVQKKLGENIGALFLFPLLRKEPYSTTHKSEAGCKRMLPGSQSLAAVSAPSLCTWAPCSNFCSHAVYVGNIPKAARVHFKSARHQVAEDQKNHVLSEWSSATP